MRGHIRRRGKTSWELKYDVREDEQRQTQYRSFKGTRAQAQAELARLLVAVDKGAHVEANKITVGQHVLSRLAQWRDSGRISPKTAERFQQLIDGQLLPFLGKIPLQRLRTSDIEAWHSALLTKGRRDGAGGVSTRTVSHVHKVLAKALREGVRHGLVVRNVASEEPPPRIEAEKMRILTPVQVRELMTQLIGRPMYAPAVTALFTGVRRGELLALRWADIDLERKMMRIHASLEETKAGLRFKGTKTKSGERELTLPYIVVTTLRDHRKQQLELRMQLGLGKMPANALVFSTAEGEPLTPNSFSFAWKDVALELKLDVSFHALRHTHASQLIDAGVDVVTIAHRLGHASPTITLSVYTHLFRQDDSKAAAVINAAFGE
jgi:integrase